MVYFSLYFSLSSEATLIFQTQVSTLAILFLCYKFTAAIPNRKSYSHSLLPLYIFVLIELILFH